MGGANRAKSLCVGTWVQFGDLSNAFKTGSLHLFSSQVTPCHFSMAPAEQEVAGAARGVWQCHSLKGTMKAAAAAAAVDRCVVVSGTDGTGDLPCVEVLGLAAVPELEFCSSTAALMVLIRAVVQKENYHPRTSCCRHCCCRAS